MRAALYRRPDPPFTSNLQTGPGVINRHRRLFHDAYHAWNYTTDPHKWGGLGPGTYPMENGGQLQVTRQGNLTRFTVARGDHTFVITRDSTRPGYLRWEQNGEVLECRGEPAPGHPPQAGGPGLTMVHTVGGHTHTYDIAPNGQPRITYPDGTVRLVNDHNELVAP